MVPSAGCPTAMVVILIEEEAFLSILPEQLRFGGVISEGRIPGPDGIWLEVDGKTAALTHMSATDAVEMCNLSLSQDVPVDEMIEGH